MTNNIEEDFLRLQSFIYSIVKPNNIEEYIYSFFNLYDDKTSKFNENQKKEIVLNTNLPAFFTLGIRDEKLFDKVNKTITLLDYEIKSINDSYFTKKADSLYDFLILEIERFNQTYFSNNRYTVSGNFEELLNFIKSPIGAYQEGKLKNIKELDVNKFKDYIQIKNNNLIRNLESKTNSTTKQVESKQIDTSIQRKTILDRSEILNRLIGLNTSKYNKFLEYEKKLIRLGYLNSERNKWLKETANFIRFYVYCEKKLIIKNDIYQENTKGVKLLRDLYNYYEGNLDAPSKRAKQMNPRNKSEFNFLDII